MQTPTRTALTLFALLCTALTACGSDVDSPTEDDATSGTGGSDTSTEPALIDFFDEELFAATPELVDCELENGSSTKCYRISFQNYQDSSGPFCPLTEDDIGGVGIYDGATNPGFQVLKKELWDGMENDGWDVVDEDGNVRLNGEQGTGTCLEMPTIDLVVTFLIPAYPEPLDTPDQIDVVELYGVAVYDGMPLTGHPPSVTDGPPLPNAQGGGIPSLDPCGGHGDPAGYWHWHFTPENSQSVLDAFQIDDVSCTDIPQKTEGLVGFAKDGYPIYSPLEDGEVPSGLDECNGLFGATPEYPSGVYHYYAVDQQAPNLPTCIIGAAAQRSFSIE